VANETRREAALKIMGGTVALSAAGWAGEAHAEKGTETMALPSKHDAAMNVISRMLPPDILAVVEQPRDPAVFGSELGDLSMTAVFEQLWTRGQLDLRTRSLVTIAILIALRATGELSIHVPAAIRNGATISEVEEVIYHAAGYAGFPAAATARGVAETALRNAGIIAR
jgi:4-carboxymuconolactone decarboxylase